MAEMFNDLSVDQEKARAEKRELLTAPGAADLTFGSLLSWMIRNGFKRVETLDRTAKHRFYYECSQCGGNDTQRSHYKSTLAGVQHAPDCLLAKHLPRLYAMANEGTT